MIVSVFHIFCIQSLLLCYNLLPYKSVDLRLSRVEWLLLEIYYLQYRIIHYKVAKEYFPSTLNRFPIAGPRIDRGRWIILFKSCKFKLVVGSPVVLSFNHRNVPIQGALCI